MRRSVVVTLCVAVAAALMPPVAARAADPTLHTGLVRIDQATGTLVDFSPTRLLYLDKSTPPRLVVKNRRTGATIPLPPVNGRPDSGGLITLRGAVRMSVAPGDYHYFLDEWTEAGTRTDLGPISPPESAVVRGSYLMWNDGSKLIRRDLNTGQQVTVATDAASPNDLLANGDVVYGAYNPGSSWINQYRAGVTQKLSPNDTTGVYTGPVTDGVNVVYRQGKWRGGAISGIWLYDGTRNIELATPSPYWAYPRKNYLVAGGWTAYMALVAGRFRLSLRAPDGTTGEVADFDGAHGIQPQFLGLSPSGQVLYSYANTLYLGAFGAATIQLASGLTEGTRYFAQYVGGRWYLAIGGNLYGLYDLPPVPLTVNIEGHGTVAVGPYGGSCHSPTCALPFAPGSTLTLTATPDVPGWRFRGWGPPCSGTGACQLTLTAAMSIKATFYAANTTSPVSTEPRAVLPVGASLTNQRPAGIPLAVVWTAKDPDGPVGGTELEVAVNDGGFAPVPLANATATSVGAYVVAATKYKYRTRAVDTYGNLGSWVTARPFTLDAVRPDQMSFVGTWSTQTSPAAWFGTAKTTTDRNARLSIRADGGQQFALVATTGPHSPDLTLSVHGQNTTVVTRSAQPIARRIVAFIQIVGSFEAVTVSRASPSADPLTVEGAILLH